MGKKEKLIEKIESKPIRKDITLQEIVQYLNYYEFEQSRQKGSHRSFIRSVEGEEKKVLTIVEHNGLIRPSYVRDCVKVIAELKGG